MEADYEVLFSRVGAEQVDVLRREAGVEEALLHGGCSRGDIAGRGIGGVDLDELFEDCAGESAVFRADGGKGEMCIRDRS